MTFNEYHDSPLKGSLDILTVPKRSQRIARVLYIVNPQVDFRECIPEPSLSDCPVLPAVFQGLNVKMRLDNVCRSAGHTEGGVGVSENGYVYDYLDLQV